MKGIQMIRVAAVGDVHYDRNSRPELRSHFNQLADRADVLLIAGDLTQSGAIEEAQALMRDLADVKVPIVAVLGNHDYHQNHQKEIQDLMLQSGIYALEGNTVSLRVGGSSIGIVGMKGFGGGFFGACITEFGEPEMKAFAHHGRAQAELLRTGLRTLNTDYKFALLHFSPIEETLLGERKEIYPFLGNYLLAEAIDGLGVGSGTNTHIGGVNGVFHGHAHMGVERGKTPGGVVVRNVAQMVIRHAYKVYTFTSHGAFASPPHTTDVGGAGIAPLR